MSRQRMLFCLLVTFSPSCYAFLGKSTYHKILKPHHLLLKTTKWQPTEYNHHITALYEAMLPSADSSERRTRTKKVAKNASIDGVTAEPKSKIQSSKSSNKSKSRSKSLKQSIKNTNDADENITWDDPSSSSQSFHDYRNKLEEISKEIETLETNFLDTQRFQLRTEAQALFDEMIEKYLLDEDDTMEPTLDIYNFLLTIYSLSPERSHNHEYAEGEGEEDESLAGDDDDDGTERETMAEIVLKRMEEDVTLPKPDKNSYLNVMNGWFQTKRYSKITSLFDHLLEVSNKHASLLIDTQIYNSVLRAWMKSEHVDGPKKVESILSDMIQLYKAGDKNSRPNLDTFIFVMETFIRRNTNLCDVKIRQLIGEMMDLKSNYVECEDLIINTTIIRNIEIKALAQRKDKNAAVEIDNIFQDMIKAFRSGNILLKPDGATFVNIMNSFKNNPTSSSVDRATSLLSLASQMYDRGELIHDTNLYRIYNAALVTIARSRNERKAEKCRAILDEMKQYQTTGKNCFAPDVRSYNSVLNACAYTKGNASIRNLALRIAVSTFNELRESKELESNHVTYGTFLKVVGNLMPQSETKDKLIETVFKKCRTEGHVSVFVLQSLTDSATPELCITLLGGDVEGEQGIILPPEWSRKCDLEHDD